MPTSATKEKQNGESNSFLYFRAERKMVKVFFRDILYVEGLKDYIRIVTDNKTIVTKYVLSTLEEMLPANDFLRIHKSYIVSKSFITAIRKNSVFIKDMELPIGENYKDAVETFTKKT